MDCTSIEKWLCVSQAYYALWLCKQFSSMESDDVPKSKPFQPHSRVSSAVSLYFMREILFVLPKACMNTRISKSIYSVGNSTIKWKTYWTQFVLQKLQMSIRIFFYVKTDTDTKIQHFIYSKLCYTGVSLQ